MLAFTLTGYWSLSPPGTSTPTSASASASPTPRGTTRTRTERKDADYWVPVLHVPVGLAVELGKRLQLAIEGRFIDGIAIGGALQVRF